MMTSFSHKPACPHTVLLLGAGEIGKEITYSLHRLGINTVALDRYPGAPAQQVAHQALTLDLLNKEELAKVITQIRPSRIIPEIEGFALEALVETGYEQALFPSTPLCKPLLHKKSLRFLAQQCWKLPTTQTQWISAPYTPWTWPSDWSFPCLLKAPCSSSGKGQYKIEHPEELHTAITHAQNTSRTPTQEFLIEAWISFDTEITLIGIKQKNRLYFCPLIEHQHTAGQLAFARQPADISDIAARAIYHYGRNILHYYEEDIFLSMEFFVKGDQVWFSELAPRPHDSAFLTLYTQNFSQFDLYVRSLLGLPLPTDIRLLTPYAAFPLYARTREGLHCSPSMYNNATHIHIFAKPPGTIGRRLGYLFREGYHSLEECAQWATQYHSV